MDRYEISKIKDYTEDSTIIFEHDIQFNGCSYLVIYGKHINGCFIAIPNWNICAEAGDSVSYNTEKLESCGLDSETALTIAQHIKETLENTK